MLSNEAFQFPLVFFQMGLIFLSLSSFQNIKLISILVQQGKLQEGELESVFKYLFPKK